MNAADTIQVLIVGIVFFTVGIGSLITGIKRLLRNRTRKNYTEKTEAVITGFKERGVYREKDGRKVLSGINYFPVYEFTKENEKHTLTSAIGSSMAKTRLKEGDKVVLCMDPDNPENWYDPGMVSAENAMTAFYFLMARIFIGVTIGLIIQTLVAHGVIGYGTLYI